MCFLLLSTKLKVGGNSLNSDIFNHQICFFHLRESKYHKHTWKLRASSFTRFFLVCITKKYWHNFNQPIRFVGLLPPTTCNFNNRACNLRCALAPPHINFQYGTVHLLSSSNSSLSDKQHNKTAHCVLQWEPIKPKEKVLHSHFGLDTNPCNTITNSITLHCDY